MSTPKGIGAPLGRRPAGSTDAAVPVFAPSAVRPKAVARMPAGDVRIRLSAASAPEWHAAVPHVLVKIGSTPLQKSAVWEASGAWLPATATKVITDGDDGSSVAPPMDRRPYE